MYVILTRPVDVNGYGFKVDDASDLILQMKRWFLFLPDPPNLIDYWVRLVSTFRVSGRQAHDTRLVAWMQAHSVLVLYTLNTKDFERFVFTIQLA